MILFPVHVINKGESVAEQSKQELRIYCSFEDFKPVISSENHMKERSLSWTNEIVGSGAFKWKK